MLVRIKKKSVLGIYADHSPYSLKQFQLKTVALIASLGTIYSKFQQIRHILPFCFLLKFLMRKYYYNKKCKKKKKSSIPQLSHFSPSLLRLSILCSQWQAVYIHFVCSFDNSSDCFFGRSVTLGNKLPSECVFDNYNLIQAIYSSRLFPPPPTTI